MRSRKIAFLAALVMGLSLLSVDSARACSCVRSDPRDQLAESDGAIIGTFQESHPATQPTPGLPQSSAEDTIYTFTVDEEVKGEFGEELEVHSAAHGASCGLEVEVGQDYGLFLTEEDGAWYSNLCRQTSPAEMREAATELPEPNGQGPPRLFVGGSFGEAQVVSLDAKGRTLGYGPGGRDGYLIAACPRGRRLAELSYSMNERRHHLVVRKVPSLEIVRDVELPYLRGRRFRRQYPSALSCVARNGSEVIVFSTDQDLPRAKSLFVAYEKGSRKILSEGSAQAATFDRARAIVRDGRNGRTLALQQLRADRRTKIATLPGDNPGPFALNRAGTKVAGVSFPSFESDDQDPFVYVATLRGRIRSKQMNRVEGVGEVLWTRDRFVLVPFFGPITVVNDKLRLVSRFGDWHSNDAVIISGILYGVGDGVLSKAKLPSGPVKKVRELPSPVTLSITGRRP